MRRCERVTLAAARRLRSSYCALQHGTLLRDRFSEPLLEIAREELAAEEAAEPTKKLVPLAVSGFLTSRKRSTAAEVADWIDSPAGRAASLASIGR